MMRTPAEMRTDAATRVLTVRWPDGATQCIAHADLRSMCPCAGCRAVRLAGRAVAADPQVTLTGIEPMGYGVQLTFSDGHARGIFPWVYLEAIGQPGVASNAR
jgi:DUF971 family protein